MILASDTFNRSSGTLGASWTEHGGTNISCDGSSARIDSAPQAHIATAIGTSQQSTYFQCWLRGSDAANLVGLCWRFQNTTNYYTVRANNTSWSVFRVGGSGGTDQIGSNFGTVATWNRIAVRHVGTRIQVYLDQSYDISFGREGPAFDEVDPDAQGSAWTGSCGIISASNNATGITNLKWNDFIAFDGTPETIYVDTTFNGGVAGEGMGTIDRPDLHIDWALNNAGLNRGGKLKFLQDGPITDPTTLQFRIGHGGKFGDTGWSWPTYDPENGAVVSAGAPNLIIEGRDGGRTILREIQAPGGTSFFKLRETATGIHFRSLDFQLTDSSSSACRTEHAGSTSEHSVSFAKCTVRFEDPSGTSVGIILESTIPALHCDFTFNFFHCLAATLEHGWFIDNDNRLRLFTARYNIFKGIAGTVPGTGAEVSYGIMFGTASDLQAGDTVDIDHNDFIDIYRVGFNEGAIGFLDATNMAGAVEFQNNIARGPGPAAPGDPTTDYGIYTANSPPSTGSITAHHNGYYRVTTERDGGVANGGNEIEDEDPEFLAESTPFTWQHTQGHGINGEGTSTAMVLPGDYRPGNAAYIDTADDSTPNLGPLDRGALQAYVPVGLAPTPGASLPIEQARIFCPSVIFDLDGPQQFDLSGRVIQMTPVRYERDILLRSYRANDVSVEFMDTEGLFLESNPDSFLLDSTGQPNWLGKPVIITAIYGDEQLHQFQGFVLEVQAGRGTGVLRLGNRFQELFDRPVLANDVVRIVGTANIATYPRVAAPSGFGGHIVPSAITVHLDVKPTVEVLTFEFTSSTQFFCTGSVSGFEGEGNIVFDFTTLSGSVTVSSNGGLNWIFTSHTYAQGEQVQVTIGWISSILDKSTQEPPQPERPIVDIYRDFLLSDQAGMLDASDLDQASIAAIEGSRANQLARPFVVDRPEKVIESLDDLSLHMGAVTIEKSNAKMALTSVMPRIVQAGSLDLLCHGDDLMAAETEHLPIYNQFVSVFDYDVATQVFQGGVNFPVRRSDNPSFTRYGRIYPAPRTLEFRSFSDEITDNGSWVTLILEVLYQRYENPTLVIKAKAKLSRFGAELDDLYEVDSEVPTTHVDAMEPFAIDKLLTDDLSVRLELVDVSAIVQEEGECGYLSYDTPGQGYDQCWGYF